MSRFQKTEKIVISILEIIAAIIVLVDPGQTYILVIYALAVFLMVSGLSYLYYYITMGRFAVGGKIHLFIGMILLDMGLITLTLTNDPGIYMLVYLLIARLFSGIVDILKGVQAKKMRSPAWKYSIIQGAANILIVLICAVNGTNNKTVLYVFCGGLIYSAIIRIINACRRNAVIYIP